MSNAKAACLIHNGPWPCKKNNTDCKKTTDPTTVKALLTLYKNLGGK